MALYREHRGILDESLKTTVIIKDKKQLLKKLLEDELKWFPHIHTIEDFNCDIKIIPYPNQENHFDQRIGWFTHMVLLSIEGKQHLPVGFLSEPLED